MYWLVIIKIIKGSPFKLTIIIIIIIIYFQYMHIYIYIYIYIYIKRAEKFIQRCDAPISEGMTRVHL